MPPNKNEQERLEEIMLENQRLMVENNLLLKKIRKSAIISFWIRLVWTLILIGAPFVVYYFVIEPYFESLGSSFETFQDGLQEIPGWKQFYQSVRGER